MMNPEIIFENEDYLIINKPAGLVVHYDGKTKEPSVADWVKKHYPELENVGEPLILENGQRINRPGIVHRLDRETSGVLVIAKNQKSFLHLKEQFKQGEVRKTYQAFVYGSVSEKEGEISLPIGRSKKDFRRRSTGPGTRGTLRPAVTHFKTLKVGSGYSYLELSPRTGRTHQIRVHLKSINHPIVGDKLYAPYRPAALGFSRLALHALSIEFKDQAGKTISAQAPFPGDFTVAKAATL